MVKNIINETALKEYVKNRNWRYDKKIINNLTIQIKKFIDRFYLGDLTDEQLLRIKTNECQEHYENGFREGYDKGFNNGLRFKKSDKI